MNSAPDSLRIKPYFTRWERWAFHIGRILILLAMIMGPSFYFPYTWRAYAPPKFAVIQYLAAFLLGCWMVIACGRRFVHSALATPTAAFFAVNMISCLVAVNLTESWETVLFVGACLILMVMIPKFFTQHRDFEIAAFFLGLICLCVDLYGLAQRFDWSFFFYIVDRWGIHKITHRPVSSMGNENYTAEFLNLAAPIIFAMIFCRRNRPWAGIFYSVVSLLNFSLLYFIDCNASFFGFLISVPLTFGLLVYYRLIPNLSNRASRSHWEKSYRQGWIILLFLISVGITLLVSIPNPVRLKMTEAASWVDTNGDHRPDGIAPIIFRLQCMDAAIQKIHHSPWLGIGPGNFKVVHPLFESALERAVLGEETLARKAHNDHLYHAAELGIFGLFSWYWIIGTSLFMILQSFRMLQLHETTTIAIDEENQTESPELSPGSYNFFFYFQWGCLGGLTTAFVSCAYGHTFMIPSSASTYWIMTGFSSAAYQTLHRAFQKLPPPQYGTTAEPLSPLQSILRFLPPSLRWGVALILLMLFGTLNQWQTIGELWLHHGTANKEGTPAIEASPNYEAAFNGLRNAMKLYPYQMEIYYIFGRYAIDAINELDKAEQKGEAGNLRLQQVRLLGQKRETLLREGIIALQTDLYMNPNYKWADNNLGVLYDKLDNSRLAQEAYGRVLTIDKQQVMAHYNLALGFMRQSKYAQAVGELEQALISDPARSEIYSFLATCFIETKDYQRALAAADKYASSLIKNQIQKALAKEPKSKFTGIIRHVERGDLLTSLQEAQQLFQFENKPCYALYLRIAADFFNGPEKNFPAALNAIKKAEKSLLVPSEDSFYLLFGNIYQAMGETLKAASKYEEYLRIKPDHTEVRRLLTNLYIRAGQMDKAERAFAKIVEKYPNTWQELLSLARLRVGAKKPWEEVFPLIKKIIELGGEEARQYIRQDDATKLMAPFFSQDARFRELLGAGSLPSTTGAASATQTVSPPSLPENR